MFRLRPIIVVVAVLVASASLALFAQGPSPVGPFLPDSTFNWMVGGTVRAVARVGNTVFIGGRFRALAPRSNLTGGFAILSAAHSRRAALTPFVNGVVNAVVFDEASSSFFVAGYFDRVGPATHARIVRIGVNGHLDLAWSGRVNGRVRALALAPRPGGGRYLYVGGEFTEVGFGATVAPARNLAAFELPAGGPPAILASFAPDPDGPVLSLAATPSTSPGVASIYAGGAFGEIGGQAIAHLARVNGATGAADTWDPSADADVWTIETSGDGGTIYAGGAFASLGGAARSRAGAVGAGDALATPWNPSPDGPVRALLRRGSQMYAGGAFVTIGGLARQRLALLDTTTGVAAPAFDAPADDVVHALALGSQAGAPLLFAGGEFTNIGGRLRLHLASLDANTGAVTDWHPAFNDTVRTVATSPLPDAPGGPGTLVAAGGDFDAFGAVARRNLAAVNLETGEVLPWRPAPDGTVRALDARGGALYVGGDFTRIDQQARHYLAAFSLVSRQLASWNPDADAPVHALATLVAPTPAGGERTSSPGTVTVYAGGDFATVGGQPRLRLAAISAATGVPTAWTPAGADGRVLAVLPTPGFVYIGGQFTTLGGVALPHLARLSTVTGEADTAWDPAPDTEVRALALDTSSVFAGGTFDTLGGAARHRVGAVDTATGAATAWQPHTDGAVNALAREGTTLYAGGTFTNVGLRRRPRLVGLDTTVSGPDANYVTAFAPRWLGQVLALDARGDGLVAAGDPLFAGDEDEPVSRVAFFPRLLHAPPSPPTTVGATALDGVVTLRWSPPALGGRPEAYLLDAGVTPGGTEVAAGVPLSGLAQSFGNVPPGTYYLRLRAANAHGVSRATGDVMVVVGAASCGAPLDPPSDLVASVVGSRVTLSWTPASGAAVASYRVEAGTTPGATAVQIAVGGNESSYATDAAPGSYFVRVRALGACGDSAPSNEVQVLAGGVGAAPQPPVNLAATVNAGTVTVAWDPSPGAVGYVVEAGSAPGTSNLASVAVPGSTFLAAGVPGGAYFLRVRAGSGAGLSGPSDELIVVVP